MFLLCTFSCAASYGIIKNDYCLGERHKVQYNVRTRLYDKLLIMTTGDLNDHNCVTCILY